MASILEESQKARKRRILGFFMRKKIIIPVIIIILAGSGVYYFLSGKKSQGVEVQRQEWTVKKDDLKISIETDGKVVAEDGVELSFSVSGDTLEVGEVFVKEGDKIKKGDKIASVKTEDLKYDLNKAYASYQSVLASYNESLDGATEKQKQDAKTSIEQAELSLAQAKISLEKTKTSSAQSIVDAEKALKDAEENYYKNRDINTGEDIRDAYSDLVDVIKSVSISLESILPDSDEILGIDDIFVNDDFEHILGVKNLSVLSSTKTSYSRSKVEKKVLDTLATPLSGNSDYADIDAAARQAEKTLKEFEEHLYDMQLLLEATITDSSLSYSSLNSFKSNINSNRTSINTKITTLSDSVEAVSDAEESLDDYMEAYEDAKKDLASAKADAEQDIANSEASLRTKELSLESAKASYNDLVSPLTAAELASLRSSLTSAAISVDKAKNDYEKSILISPIDGEVALLNYKPGDIILTADNKPMAAIINNETLFIEVNIEEADINKLKIGQKSYATFDALDGLRLEGEVTFISLTSETDNQGIVTYLVRVVFNNAGENQVREGMTAFVDFVTAEAKDVLVAPVDAVRNIEGKPSVESTDGTWIPISTGFTDGEYVEVISGLNEGDKIFN